MMSAYEHGRNAAKHAKHIQACPFDTGTTEWRDWRAGFHGFSQTSPKSSFKLAIAPKRRAGSSLRPSWSPFQLDTMRSSRAQRYPINDISVDTRDGRAVRSGRALTAKSDS
jgi:hypothetical protein